jgi:hypothetical protein
VHGGAGQVQRNGNLLPGDDFLVACATLL